MKLNKCYLYPILFYKVLPNAVTTVNLSPIAFLLAILDSRKYFTELKRLSINILVPFLLLTLLSTIQIFFNGYMVLKPLILLTSSILGGLYLAIKISKYKPIKSFFIFLSYYFIISIISINNPEGSIYFPFQIPAISGLTGFGGLSTPVLFYLSFTTLLSFKNIILRLASYLLISLLFLLSYNNSAVLIYFVAILILSFIISLALIKQFRLLLNSILFSRIGILLILLIVLFIGTFSLYIIKNSLDEEFVLYLDGLTSFRIGLANEAINSFRTSDIFNIFFGHGLGAGYYNLYIDSDVISNFWNSPKQIHNTFISILYDTGIVGSSLLLLSFTYIYSGLYKYLYRIHIVNKMQSLASNNKAIYIINIIASLVVFIELASMDKYTDLLSYTIMFLIPLTLINHLNNQDIQKST